MQVEVYSTCDKKDRHKKPKTNRFKFDSKEWADYCRLLLNGSKRDSRQKGAEDGLSSKFVSQANESD